MGQLKVFLFGPALLVYLALKKQPQSRDTYGSNINLREKMSTTERFDYALLDQEWLQDYQNAECGEPLSSMKRAYRSPLQIGASVYFV